MIPPHRAHFCTAQKEPIKFFFLRHAFFKEGPMFFKELSKFSTMSLLCGK